MLKAGGHKRLKRMSTQFLSIFQTFVMEKQVNPLQFYCLVNGNDEYCKKDLVLHVLFLFLCQHDE